MDWIRLLLGLAPTILTAAKTPAAMVQTIVLAMADAQALKGASGPDKKTHVLGIVKNAVDVLNEAKGKTVLDPAQVVAAVGAGIDTTIATINLVKDRHAA